MKYWAVVVPDTGEPELKSFDTLELLARFLRRQPDGARGFFFSGDRLLLTHAPWRYLVHGECRLPLFDPPDPEGAELDDSGRLGDAPASPEDVDYSHVMKATMADQPPARITGPAAAPADDEEIDDDVEVP
jgi:hypothetical protein